MPLKDSVTGQPPHSDGMEDILYAVFLSHGQNISETGGGSRERKGIMVAVVCVWQEQGEYGLVAHIMVYYDLLVCCLQDSDIM